MTPNPCSQPRFAGSKSLSPSSSSEHLDDLHAMSVSTASSLSSSSSDEGGNSSSGEESSVPFEVPSAQLMGRIVSVVEGLFSDENLVRDEFMNKNTRKNRGGYVNLKLLAAFRKVKYLSKDWRVVAYALAQRSTALELSEEGTKVRRKQPLHTVDGGSKYDRTVFVLNLPATKEDINQLHRDFAVFGRIGLIRILRPSRSGGGGGSSSPSVNSTTTTDKLLATLVQQVPSMAVDQAVGAVEFNHIEDAQSCLQSQHRLISFDTVWSKVMLCIVKKSDGSSGGGGDSIEYTKMTAGSRITPNSRSSKTTTTTTTTLPELCSTVINKPVDDQSMIVITVTSSGITLTSAKSSNGQTAAKLPVRTPSSPPIIRQPKGPDGSRGFIRR